MNDAGSRRPRLPRAVPAGGPGGGGIRPTGRCLAGVLLLLALCGGCSIDVRPDAPACTNPQDYTGSMQPFHTITLGRQNDFTAEKERFFPGSPVAPYAAYVTWDACTVYLGFEGPSLGPGGCRSPDPAECPIAARGESPSRYVMFYLDTDPLGDHGTIYGRPTFGRRWQLPFKADYLLEIRTDGRMVETEDGFRYNGNVQLYRRAVKWSAGLIRHWQAMGNDGVRVFDGTEDNLIQVALARGVLGQPCALQTVAWVEDRKARTRYGFWPAPDTLSSGALTLNYYGFQLIDGVVPSASDNLNRTAYHAVGACAGQVKNQQ